MTIRKAIITGGGSGIGRAIALKLAAEGYQLALLGRTQSKLDAVAAEVAAAGGTAGTHAIDLTDASAIDAFADSLDEQRIDALVNCAGDWLIASLADTAPAQLDHLLALNLRAPYLLSRALLPNLRRSDNASILNIGSIVTAMSVPMVSAYTAAKVGLKGMTGSLAAELKPERIRVVMLSPGPADTPMRDAASPGIDKAVLVRPETIADMANVLLSLPRGITTSDFTLHSMVWE